MQKAQYLRDQAEKCLSLARYITDKKSAKILKSLAAHYHERAQEIECGNANVAASHHAPCELRAPTNAA
jgi:hypothetical protein